MRSTFALLVWCLTAAAIPATAQTFPEHTIRLIVPVPPGGSTDAVARLVTARMQAILGQPMIIENQGGAGGLIAARAVAGARPDGYTLLIGGIGTLALGPIAKTSEVTPAAFAPIATVSTETMTLVVNPKVPADTLDAFVRYAKTSGAKLNYGAAPGIAPHFVSELFRLKTGTDIVHIPYKGAGPAITDLLAGQIEMMFNNKSVLLQLIRQGRLRSLAVAGATRWPELPDVPTLVEAGIFPYPLEVWWGIVGPAGMPRPIVARLNGAINDALQSAELKASFASLGIDARISTPEDFAALIAQDAPRWLDIIRITGIRLE
jgi:tripartite-type tricarboxylate transporter receptor subunit TctC